MVTAYPVTGKRKSFDVCLAFARGAGGQIAAAYRPGPAAFYGVDASNIEIWRQVRANGDDYWYIDNSVFDSARQTYFRVAKNRLQHDGIDVSDGARFRALNIPIAPWRERGEHIVLCPQSESFMRFAGYAGDWTADTVAALRQLTDRDIHVRKWSADKGRLAATLADDLRGAHALVTYSSAAAVTAVLAGVPVVTMWQCVAAPMAGSIEQINNLPMPARENWAGVLADREWNLAEMANGTAWKALLNE
ncbi:MAG TPA: hypothetical protein VNU48_12980 [Burkholderiaceae bacterium]|nr:hypothetical protein [Burkholderiaceae bacterium]